MGALFALGVLGALAIAASSSRSSSSSRSRRSSSSRSSSSSSSGRWSMSTPIADLDPTQAAMRAGWTYTQSGADAARTFVAAWLAVPGRNPIDAGSFAHELQQLHRDDLAEYAIDQWNTLHAPGSTHAPSSSSSSLATASPDAAAAAVGDTSSEQAAHDVIAHWLAVPGRTAMDAGRFIARLQALHLEPYAEFAMDTWNERPTE